MRKTDKKWMEELIALLGQAHGEIVRAIEKKNEELARELLVRCQEAAITLGNRIEQAEGGSCRTIPLLEEYCELLYQVYEGIGTKVNTKKIYKTLQTSLIKIENSIRLDIKIRIEAVFLPYKASMWDSMESVWKAADEDPDCDAYVIPIPYYEKNPDGSIREEHYEGTLYPEYVSVTEYGTFDFQLHRPDMIFIHNPYDSSSYVTTVPPFFYSGNLKQYTEKLIYIPYFTLAEMEPEDSRMTKQIAPFCMLPAVRNADWVIVQSENMRRIYIDVLTKWVDGSTRTYWEQKILGLGSPKFDKVLFRKKEEIKIPEHWERVMRKEDGSLKKVILYNTAINTLLDYGEQLLKKMREVFQTFKENCSDVALLWRPHPLMKATICSMCPQLWAEYEKIVEQYKDEGWGIYDDSAELERAIAVSDGYYGDPSSLVQLCQKAGIPVMIQKVG